MSSNLTWLAVMILFAAVEASCNRKSVQSGGLADVAMSDGQLLNFTHSFAGVSSPYRLRSPIQRDPELKRPLLVFFHGNLGSNFGPASLAPQRILAPSGEGSGLGQKLPTLDQIILEESKNDFWRPYVLLAILTPTDSDRDYKGGKVITWGSVESPLSKLPLEQLDFNADFANDLITKVIERENVDRRRVILVGQSGGSLFLTNTFIPKFGNQFGGGAILLCGGEAPREQYRPKLTSEFARRFSLHFQSTTNESEHIKPLLGRAVDEYSQLWHGSGRPPTMSIDGDGKHCKFGSGTQPFIIEKVLKQWSQ